MKPSDWPPSITLRKPTTFRFKKGTYVTLEKKAPLFFGSDYLRDGKAGTQLEVLDYNPEKQRVYCRSKGEHGDTIAVNILETHLKAGQGVTVPSGTVVGADRLVGDKVWISYDGARQAVPLSDTDLLDQAKQQRSRNEVEARRQAEQVDSERRARDYAALQAIAEKTETSAHPARLGKSLIHRVQARLPQQMRRLLIPLRLEVKMRQSRLIFLTRLMSLTPTSTRKHRMVS